MQGKKRTFTCKKKPKADKGTPAMVAFDAVHMPAICPDSLDGIDDEICQFFDFQITDVDLKHCGFRV